MSRTWGTSSLSHRPLSFGFRVSLAPPSEEDRVADADRLRDALGRLGLRPVHVPLDVLQKLPDELRKNKFVLPVVMGRTEQGYAVLDICNSAVFGIALDIGTTTIECVLFDLNEGKRIDSASAANPQTVFGADVLARVQAAMTGRGGELTRLLREGIDRLILEVCERNGVSKQKVYAITVAGNTIMSHFFLGLEVGNLPVSPNIPVMGQPVFCAAAEAALSVHPNAVVYVFPNAGSYVGGDIISGMVAIGILGQESPVLFVDAGTNVEITLGCREWIMVGAGAAGPALEGGVADIGRKAEAGSISHVEIERESGEARLTVIGEGEPEGICGSGLIDLVSELFSAGIIDRAGRFDRDRKGVVVRDGVAAYRLYQSPRNELVFTERELQNFLRSKGAMFALLYVFLRSVGMKIRDIERIYISGALGCGINLDSAVNIGMLPDIRREKIVPVGNSSLTGACQVLRDGTLTDDVLHIRSLITYREMREDADLLNVLQGALFLPHTDPELLKG